MLLSKSTQGLSVHASTGQNNLVGKTKKSGNLDVLAIKISKFWLHTALVSLLSAMFSG